MTCEDTSKSLSGMVFVLLVRSAIERAHAELLIASLRRFGGPLCENPVWVFASYPNARCRDLRGVAHSILAVPEVFQSYPFGDKVFACAKAEVEANASVHTLVFLDTSYLIVQPPLLFNLGKESDLAVRPVHIRNVGSPVEETVDLYWASLYRAVGLPEADWCVTSFVDGQHLRPYFNTHAFAVRPSVGLCRRWRTLFESLISDRGFQAAACGDPLHKLFLFQASLSALCTKMLTPHRIRLLPESYNYPYNLQPDVPHVRRARTLNELVTVVYEGRHLDPNRLADLLLDEPLRQWLSKKWSHVELSLARSTDSGSYC